MYEIRLWHQRWIGEWLRSMPKRDGGDAMRARSHDVTELPPKLEDLGIQKMQASRYQALAEIPIVNFIETTTRRLPCR